MAKKRVDGKVNEQVEIVRVSLDEFNLATFPVSVLDKKAQRSHEPLHFQDVITVAGRQIERHWKVYPHQEEGFPGPADDDVLMALFELTREQNGAKKIYFTRYQLCKKLGWPLNKFYYKRIESSFRKLGAVHVEATNAYGDRDRKKFINLGFTIIQEYKLYDETANGSKLSYVLWSDRIAASITQKLTKYLDASFYFEELETPLEKRLFRFLDSHFVQSQLVLVIPDLCYEHLGIARRYKYVSQLMQKLEGPLQKLVEKGFLASWKQEGQRLWVVRSERFAERLRLSMPLAEIIADISDEPKKQEDSRIASELTARGVDAAVARDISMRAAGRYEAEVMDAISYFDSECARGKKFANPAGLLVSLIRRSMPPEETPPARSRRVNKPQSPPVSENLNRARAEIEYQEYVQRIGREQFGLLNPSERDQILQEARKDLLSSPHASRYRRMPSDRFAEHLQSVVEGRLARSKALPFDRWYTLWMRSQEGE